MKQRVGQPALWLLAVPLLLASVVFMLASSGLPAAGQTMPTPTAIPDLSVIHQSETRFSWNDGRMLPAAGSRIVDISTQAAEAAIYAPDQRDTPVGLFAVDPLQSPRLNGISLLRQMPTESALTITPEGTAWFTYSDIFDPGWRGRQSVWEPIVVDDQQIAIDRVLDDSLLPKVARDADIHAASDMFFLLDNENQVSFYWSGELRYCFDFGRGVTAFALSDPDGIRKTTLDTQPGFEIRLSGGPGSGWIPVWRSDIEGRQQPDIRLPEELQGRQSLCISFGGDPEAFYTIDRLYISARFDAPDLIGLTSFPPGERTLTFEDAPDSSHHAILFWDDPEIVFPETEITYPADAPVIEQDEGALRLLFPGGILLEFPLSEDGSPGGLSRLVIGQQTVFRAAPGASRESAATLTMLDGTPTPLPADFDWAAYRDVFVSGQPWPSLWTRTKRPLNTDSGQFAGARVEGDAVVLQWTAADNGQAGTVEWIFAPAETEAAGALLPGVGMRMRVSGPGLMTAESIRFSLPLVMSRGDWLVGQVFRELLEDEFSFQAVPRYPQTVWFGIDQSFVFRSGPGRTVLALFDSPTAAVVRLSEEAGRQVYTFDMPLGQGDVRETPTLFWFAADRGAANHWAAADLWAQLYEQIKTLYSGDAGVLASRPVPSVVWNLPFEEDILAALEAYAQTGSYPPPGEGWFDVFAQTQLPRAEAAGIRNLIIQPPWTSDAEDPALIASLHAARDFHVSDLLGGRDALRRLVEEAHRRGIMITLWYPSALSLYSPLLAAHPDWMAWEITGIPNDGGWGDIVGLDTRTAYRQYAIDSIAALHRDIPFDGLWMDSWMGLAMLTDYSDAQPSYQLDTAIALQRAFSEMGISQLIIEGLGPLGRPDAYGDYETYTGPPHPNPVQVAELERLRGHEYLLYRLGAGTYIDMAIYHRALASGGLLNIANFDEIDALSDADRAWLRQVNLDHRRVVDRMQYRRLLVDDDRWLGVAWTQDGTDDIVLFAFQSFAYRPDGAVCAEDVTTGEAVPVTDVLITVPYHTYILHSGPPCG